MADTSFYRNLSPRAVSTCSGSPGENIPANIPADECGHEDRMSARSTSSPEMQGFSYRRPCDLVDQIVSIGTTGLSRTAENRS